MLKNNHKRYILFAFCFFILCFMGTTSDIAASEKEFVIKEGVLLSYNGKGGKVVIPEEVTTIDTFAFMYSQGIEEVIIPDSVTQINISAFSYSDLRRIKLSSNIKTIDKYVFEACFNLESIIIPEGVVSISNSAFAYCENLKSVSIPKTVINIGENAFLNCQALEYIKIPDSVTEIGMWAFSESGLKNIDLSNSLNNLSEGVFYGCKFTSIKIPDNITKIEDRAFSNCDNLESVIFPKNLKEIGFAAFSFCTKLKKVTLPDTVNELGNGVFDSCYNLSDITLPNSIKYIPAVIFYGCDQLKSISIPKGVTFIGNNAFGFSGLETINIPDTVTVIDYLAFDGCGSLKTINIPVSVKDIRSGAFRGTKWLADYKNDFVSVNRILLAYKGKDSNIVIPNEITSISGNAFDDQVNYNSISESKIATITIPNSVKSIDASSLSNLPNLKYVVIPKSVTSIKSMFSTNFNDKMIIYGIKGSEAERYAKEKNIKFKEIGSIVLNQSKATLYIGGKDITLNIEGPVDNIKWKSSNPKVVTVSSRGKITAIKAGKATITATSGKYSATCSVTVKTPYISKKEVIIKQGKSSTLSLVGIPSGVVWSSDNSKIASVNKSGKVTAKGVGKTIIRAKYNGKTYKCTVIINK